MKKIFILFISLFFISIWESVGYNSNSTIYFDRIHADNVSVDNSKFLQRIYFQTDTAQLRKLDGSLYDASVYLYSAKGDSELICSNRLIGLEINASNYSTVLYTGNVNSKYLEVCKKINNLPPGIYKTYIKIYTRQKDTLVNKWDFEVDSLLKLQSPVRTTINNIILPLKDKKSNGAHEKSLQGYFQSSGNKFSRLLKSKGFTYQAITNNKHSEIMLFCDGIFVGKYQSSTNNIYQQISLDRERIKNKFSDLLGNSFEDGNTIFSQINKNEENNEIVGNIGLLGNISNNQEEQSEVENNYYELSGDISAPILGIPIMIQGFYTSQDNRRKVKSSYINIKYDVEKAKSELQKLIASYKSKYNTGTMQGGNMAGIYQRYIHQLKTYKDSLVRSYAIDTLKISVDTSQLSLIKDTLINNEAQENINQTINSAKNTADSLQKIYQQAQVKLQQIQALQNKIDKAQQTIAQYNNAHFFDSALAYNELQNLDYSDETSYKKLSQKASAILPEGKAKTFISGITNFEVGIFSKEISSYTISGQTIKGIDVGYDLGFCQTAFTVGRVEYVGRDGTLDKYMGYSGSVMFEPVKKQKSKITYYSYSPSRSMFSDNNSFFKNIDVALPSFRGPVHILSVAHNASILKKVDVKFEISTSYKNVDQIDEVNINDRLAYNVEALVPLKNGIINLIGSYEHVGKGFENSSLPILLGGVERCKIGGDALMLKGFLRATVEYNYLMQQNFSGVSNNSKWGFSIQTISKRYPTVSVSYKPFSTFRRFDDTLSILERPIIGSVFLSKIGYQIKNENFSIRLMALYNNNQSQIASDEYSNTLMQFNAFFLKGKFIGTLTAGANSATGGNTDGIHANTSFLNLSENFSLFENWNFNIAQGIGVSAYGVSKYNAQLYVAHTLTKAKMTIRAGGRYINYKTDVAASWKQVLNGTIDISWQFKYKLNEI